MSEQLLDIVLRSIWISGTALLLSLIWSLPISFALGLKRFRGRGTIISFFNAMLGVPTVALGLFLYLIFSRRGALGILGILYTPTAIIIGQAVLITPILVSLLTNAIESVEPKIRDLARTLGASECQASLAVLKEARKGGILAGISAFNRAIAELGIALMLGGNIQGLTRVMTTQIALGVNRGELMLSIEATAVLLIIVFSLTLIANRFRGD
ncbi:MAG: ABC transporter permease [Candidatus Hadarchaeum sp.]|uniref:ABC transporter permease n=1 Tax=Candidatus Hadarchaeum sp. TaxID=2883567 RepID=UPI003D0EBC47